LRKIGLIGGTSWESTAIYYRLLNEAVRQRRGGFHSARLVLASVDFAQYEAWMRQGNWQALADALTEEAYLLHRAGAQAIVLCTNTMHKVAGHIRNAVQIPFLDIRDVTGQAIVGSGYKRPLLLGTRYTMADDFFTAHLETAFGLVPVVPSEPDQARINSIIFDELVAGLVQPTSRAAYVDIVARAQAAGADSVIFGCTEIGMLLRAQDVALPIFDTMQLHVDAALEFALSPLHTL